MNIQFYLPAFREHYAVMLGRGLGTIALYVRTLERFDTWLTGGSGGSPDVADITRSDVEAWLKHLFYHQGNTQNISRAGKLSAIKAFWKFLAYKKIIHENPMDLIPSPRIARTLPQKFSTQQLRSIFARTDLSTPIGVRDMAILKTLYGSGPRVDEIRNLDVDDLHHGRTDIYLHFRKTKGGEDRVVHLLRNPSEAIMNWLAIRENHAYDPENNKALFVSMTSNMSGARLSVKAYNEILKKYASLVGIKNERVFVHKMRATFATDLYDLGFDILEISYIMGHKSVETTQRYIAISERALKKTAIPNKRWRELERGKEEDAAERE